MLTINRNSREPSFKNIFWNLIFFGTLYIDVIYRDNKWIDDGDAGFIKKPMNDDMKLTPF